MLQFTSDLHFFHENILNWASIRHKWKTVDEMNNGLVAMWNESVSQDDTVYNLGDLAFKTGSKMNEINALLLQLKGKHIVLKGNHDSDKKIPLFQNIAEWHKDLILNIQGIDFLLAHFPYKHAMKDTDTIERPECFTPDRIVDGKIMPEICGHVHDFYQIKPNCLNVGFDAWGKMLSENEIMEIYKDTNGFKENLDKYNKA